MQRKLVANLDKMAGGRATLYFRGLALSYRPPMGLAAAKIDARALSVACVEVDPYKAGENSDYSYSTHSEQLEVQNVLGCK